MPAEPCVPSRKIALIAARRESYRASPSRKLLRAYYFVTSEMAPVTVNDMPIKRIRRGLGKWPPLDRISREDRYAERSRAAAFDQE